MSTTKGLSNWMMGDNSQCSCFGQLKRGQDRFLANYNAFTHPYKITQLAHITSQQVIAKNNGKKSLKKTFVPLFSQNRQNKNKNTLFTNNKQKVCTKLAKSRSLKKATSQQTKKKDIHSPSFTYNSPILFSSQTKQQSNIAISSNNSYTLVKPLQMRAVSSLLEYSPRNNYPSYQYSTPIKITYTNSSKYLWNQQPSKKQEILKSNQFQKQELTTKRITLPQQFSSVREIREPINLTILSKSQSFKLAPPSPQTQLNIQKCDTSMLQNSIQINITQVQAQSPPLKYSWDKPKTPTNILTTHRSQQLCVTTVIPKLPSLKKMDDVMEICSQADSEDDSQSDKQSIVLGRLNQYSSMMQQKNKGQTISSVIDKKLQSRLAKIGSLNSTIGHCQSMKLVKE